MSVGENPSPERNSITKNDEHIERGGAVIPGNRLLTVREFADEVDMGIGSCHKIFTEKNSHASRQCKIRAAFVDRRSE